MEIRYPSTSLKRYLFAKYFGQEKEWNYFPHKWKPFIIDAQEWMLWEKCQWKFASIFLQIHMKAKQFQTKGKVSLHLHVFFFFCWTIICKSSPFSLLDVTRELSYKTKAWALCLLLSSIWTLIPGRLLVEILANGCTTPSLCFQLLFFF